MEIKKVTADQFQDIRLFYHHVIDGIAKMPYRFLYTSSCQSDLRLCLFIPFSVFLCSLYSDYRQAVS